MTKAQRLALRYPSLLAEETAHPRFGTVTALGTVVLSINSGYE